MIFRQSLTAKSLVLNLCATMLGLVLILAPGHLAAHAQEQNDRERAIELYDAQNFVAAAPLLDKLATASPNDIYILSRLGFALYASSVTEKDQAARQKMRDRARTILLRSQSLGDNSNLTRIALDGLSKKDATDVPFSNVKAAEAAMREGEDAFVRGDLDKALAKYKQALELDPRLYEAALYAGDMEFKKGYQSTDPAFRSNSFDRAGEWFAKAIAINPDRETAYRYWGDALDAQGKSRDARDRFIDAIVAEPYSRTSYVGLTQWADRHKVPLAHPKIEVPAQVSSGQDRLVNISIDPKMLDQKDDGSGAWMLYGAKRALWRTKLFAQRFPNEKEYRHTLAEETDALRAVVEQASSLLKDEKVKILEPSLSNLMKLNSAGLLESYILFARPDQGIARDYAAYRLGNRDKLRRYWRDVVAGQQEVAVDSGQ
jgi:tetratricopeptide (TPR) repeat protein